MPQTIGRGDIAVPKIVKLVCDYRARYPDGLMPVCVFEFLSADAYRERLLSMGAVNLVE